MFNYLGTGSNPRISLQLSANGNGWNPYSIDYQSRGNIPWSSDSANNWSTWNVNDENSNYYGTITIEDVSGAPSETKYVGGSDGYYLEGIHFDYISADTYQLTVDTIHGGATGNGPFPDAPVATPALYPDSQDPIVLSTAGDNIVNDKGASIILKGLVRPSLEWNAQGQYLSPSDITNIRNWGANVIRIDLNQGYWLSSAPISTKGSYKQIVDAIIYYATQNNMAVILDLHWLTPNGGQQPMANSDSIAFWQQVATQYKDFGTVIFELYNEPYGISQTYWLNGGGGVVGYQELYNAVRGTGANNICIVSGLDYAYDLSFVNDTFCVTGSNIVYCSHPYNQKGEAGYTGAGGTFAHDFAGILGKHPIVFTEFGVNDNSYFPAGYQSIYATILAYANANHISYSGFAWWVDSDLSKANSFPDLIADWSGTPLNGGAYVHDDLQNAPGTPITSTSSLWWTSGRSWSQWGHQLFKR
ncbi:MAG: glycoside hydrolase family 5 protein [Chthoniobacterales bacterium]